MILSIAMVAVAITTMAQGKFEVKNFKGFKLHSYITADPLGDINYLVETPKGIIVIEPAAFYDNIKELNAYIQKLGKPVVKVISDYHIAGYSGFDKSKYVRVEGMPEFAAGQVYGGMMTHFGEVFKGKMDVSKYGKTELVARNAKKIWAGVEFQFAAGTGSDFPASSIVVGKQVYYTHFTPAQAHPSPLQIHSREAVNAVLAELEKVKASGCKVVIGGHGMATTDMATVGFEINYLQKTNELLAKESTKEGFVAALKAAYPALAGAENIDALAENLYK